MNRILIVIAAALVLLVGVIAAFAFFWQGSQEPAVPNDNPFGFTGDTTPGGGTTTQAEPVRTITLMDGSTVAIPDVMKMPQPEWAGDESGYEVAGDVEESFHILYYPDNAGFSVTLLSEPLKDSRLAAEQALRAELKLSDDQLCKLNMQVNTIRSVNETYAGRSLGLSFCPNAVTLP